MPVMDGIELARIIQYKINANEFRDFTVIMTSSGIENDVQQLEIIKKLPCC